jgi:hypothetical protein
MLLIFSSFGVVFAATRIATGEKVAVKKIAHKKDSDVRHNLVEANMCRVRISFYIIFASCSSFEPVV